MSYDISTCLEVPSSVPALKEPHSKVNLMATYEVIKNNTVVVKSPGSVKLPIYDAVLNGTTPTAAIVDGGATT